MLPPFTQLAPCGLAELSALGVVLEANDILVEWIGRARAEVIGHELFEFVNDQQGTLRAALQSDVWDGTPFTLTVELQAGHSPRQFLLASSSYEVDGETRMSIVFFDASVSTGLTEQARSDRDLARRTSERFRVLVETAASFGRASAEVELGDLLVDAVRVGTGADAVAVYTLGPDGDFIQLAGSNPLLDRYPKDAPTVAAEALRSEEPVLLGTPAQAAAFAPGFELDTVFVDAGVSAVMVSPILDHERIGAVAAFFETEPVLDDQVLPLAGALARQAAQVFVRIRLEEDARRAANLDQVTGLANRRLLEEHVAPQASSAEGLMAALFLDLDGFKSVNDELSHAVGDQLLAEVGKRITSVIRDRDAVARYGGDEFVALCTVPDEQTALHIAERVRSRIDQPFHGPLAQIPVSASIGVAVAPTPASIDKLIRAADLAMYEAKDAGGNTIRRASMSA
jgi:diguanylate cyclase (GGDEF)-like protein